MFPAPPGRYTQAASALCNRHLGAYSHLSQGISDVSGFPRVIVSVVWRRDGGVGNVAGHLQHRSQITDSLYPKEEVEGE